MTRNHVELNCADLNDQVRLDRAHRRRLRVPLHRQPCDRRLLGTLGRRGSVVRDDSPGIPEAAPAPRACPGQARRVRLGCDRRASRRELSVAPVTSAAYLAETSREPYTSLPAVENPNASGLRLDDYSAPARRGTRVLLRRRGNVANRFYRRCGAPRRSFRRRLSACSLRAHRRRCCSTPSCPKSWSAGTRHRPGLARAHAAGVSSASADR